LVADTLNAEGIAAGEFLGDVGPELGVGSVVHSKNAYIVGAGHRGMAHRVAVRRCADKLMDAGADFPDAVSLERTADGDVGFAIRPERGRVPVGAIAHARAGVRLGGVTGNVPIRRRVGAEHRLGPVGTETVAVGTGKRI
jgi:hypothetical protein